MSNQTDQAFLESALSFFPHLSSAEKNLLLQNTAAVSYKKGSSIHRADYKCLGLLLVKSGSLRVYIMSEDGREITLYRIYPGELCILSASCVLSSITFDVYIDAVEDSQVLQVSSSVISLLMHDNIYVEAFAYRAITERFSDVMWAMQQILFMSFDRRLASFLLEETEVSGSDRLKMTHEQIARLLGSAREVVSRMLKYFSEEGMVSLGRGTIQITDREKLKALLS